MAGGIAVAVTAGAALILREPVVVAGLVVLLAFFLAGLFWFPVRRKPDPGDKG